MLIVILEYFLDDGLNPGEILHNEILKPSSVLWSLILVGLCHLPEEVHRSNYLIIEVALDHLVYSLPRVIDKDDDMHDFFEYLSRGSFWVDLIEDVEEIIAEEVLALVGEWVVGGVVPGKEIVLEGRGDDGEHVFVSLGDEGEKLIDEEGVSTHPLELHLTLVDRVVIETPAQHCAQPLALVAQVLVH